MITKEVLAGKILDYLNRRITSNELVKWAETEMVDSDYQEDYFEIIADSLSQIGVSDVNGFSLPVASFLNMLKKLDYNPIFGLEPTKNETEETLYL